MSGSPAPLHPHLAQVVLMVGTLAGPGRVRLDASSTAQVSAGPLAGARLVART